VEIPKSIRYAVSFLVKGLVALILGLPVTLYTPALAEAPAIERGDSQLPNIQTLETYPLADNIEFSDKQIYKLTLYVESISNGLNYQEFKKLNALVHCESSWRPEVYGDSGKAYSLAQFHKPTFEDFKRWSEQSHLKYTNPEHQLKLLVWGYKNKKMKNWTCWK
jgi:hypothetical protein